jgi:leucine dehydrogenase
VSVFEAPEFDDHEEVVFVNEATAGLRGISAIHDTTLGPALGGCRMWDYETEADAIRDVLRLSRGMT